MTRDSWIVVMAGPLLVRLRPVFPRGNLASIATLIRLGTVCGNLVYGLAMYARGLLARLVIWAIALHPAALPVGPQLPLAVAVF